MMKRDYSVLTILIFNNFHHQNHEKWYSAIKLCAVLKYASRMEHTRSLSIIDTNNVYVFKRTREVIYECNPFMIQCKSCYLLFTVMFYEQTENILFHMKNMLYFTAYVTFLTKTSNLPMSSCFFKKQMFWCFCS